MVSSYILSANVPLKSWPSSIKIQQALPVKNGFQITLKIIQLGLLQFSAPLTFFIVCHFLKQNLFQSVILQYTLSEVIYFPDL